MLGKRRRELVELQQKGKSFDYLMNELKRTEIRVTLNNMPLLIIDLEHALILMRLNNEEMEICKTHGQANVDARLIRNRNYGIVEKGTTETAGAP